MLRLDVEICHVLLLIDCFFHLFKRRLHRLAFRGATSVHGEATCHCFPSRGSPAGKRVKSCLVGGSRELGAVKLCFVLELVAFVSGLARSEALVHQIKISSFWTPLLFVFVELSVPVGCHWLAEGISINRGPWNVILESVLSAN